MKSEIVSGKLALLDKEGVVVVKGKGKFIFVAGNPLDESMAWGGHIVMNTSDELDLAFKELDEGTSIKGDVPSSTGKS